MCDHWFSREIFHHLENIPNQHINMYNSINYRLISINTKYNFPMEYILWILFLILWDIPEYTINKILCTEYTTLDHLILLQYITATRREYKSQLYIETNSWLGSMTSEACEFPRRRRRRLSKTCFVTSRGYPVTREPFQKYLAHERKTIRRRQGGRFFRGCVSMGTFQEKKTAMPPPPAARIPGARTGDNPCDKEGPQLLNTLGKGSVRRLYLVTVSSPSTHMLHWRSHEQSRAVRPKAKYQQE